MNGKSRDEQMGDPLWKDATDLECTVHTNANVLLTGPAEVAHRVARRVHEESGWRHGPFTLIDCTRPEGLGARVGDAFDPGPAANQPSLRLSQDGTVLLQEVGRLPKDVQARLANLLATPAGRRRRRVIASTSEWLLPRVLDGTFNDELFYRLNAIHLLLTGAAHSTRPRSVERRASESVPFAEEGYSSRRASVG